jgi:DNA-binding response OmpR family regulator
MISGAKGEEREAKGEGRRAMGEETTLQHSKTPALHRSSEPSIQPASEEPIILIVEDHADLRRYIREQMEPAYRVHEAANGAEGLEAARELIPDLVISDVMMPKMNGYELCTRLKTDERTSHVPVILLTAKAAGRDKIAGLETGADDYLAKPFDSQELAARVKNLIALRRKLRERFSRATFIKPSEVSAASMDQAFLQRVTAAIEANFGEEDFSIEALAAEVHMSASQLNRKLKALIDQPAGELLRAMRMQRAADLLAQNAGSIAEIALQVGFSDQAHFTRSFKRQFGVSPKEYRRQAENRSLSGNPK